LSFLGSVSNTWVPNTESFPNGWIPLHQRWEHASGGWMCSKQKMGTQTHCQLEVLCSVSVTVYILHGYECSCK
jgi:hypothetical protein